MLDTLSRVRRKSCYSGVVCPCPSHVLFSALLTVFSSRRHYRTPDFADKLLEIFDVLRVPSWYKSTTTPNAIKIHKVSGSLTNAVFFVSLPSHSSRTLLLRIYGSSSGSLISRPRELHTLHVLSSTYGMGPRVYGTFENGRVEEYFDSVTLTADDIRVPRNSRHIGARMAELHGVDIAAIEGSTQSGQGTAKDWHIGAQKNVTSWLSPARKVLSLPVLPDEVRRELDLDVFQEKWERYMKWVKVLEKAEGASKRVFCHNDAQYGNLLKLKQLPDGTPEHREVRISFSTAITPGPDLLSSPKTFFPRDCLFVLRFLIIDHFFPFSDHSR